MDADSVRLAGWPGEGAVRGSACARCFPAPRAAELLRAWLREMPTQMRKSSSRLVFPNHRGERRSKGERSWWQVAKARAKIPKFFRWHDLRHTCASSLLAGWWGRAWRLEVVKEYLGHSDIKVTHAIRQVGGVGDEGRRQRKRRVGHCRRVRTRKGSRSFTCERYGSGNRSSRNEPIANLRCISCFAGCGHETDG